MSTKVILIRHGESEWNLENRFTGWTDVDLTKKGEIEAKEAGNLILKNRLRIDEVYCSYLKRAKNTCRICITQLKIREEKVFFDWRLNERHYGSLQGLNKAETAKKFGEEQVLIWRRSYDIAPPSLDFDDDRHPRKDPLYKNINNNLLPGSESLKDTLFRIKPLLNQHIIPKIASKKNIMIVAHGNSIRAIIKTFMEISDEDIIKLNIPTGSPYVLEFNKELEVIKDYYIEYKNEINSKTNSIEAQRKFSS